MAITTKTVFETTDGKTFADQAQATAHQVAIDTKASLEKYVEALTFKSTTPKGLTLSRNRVKKTVLGYLSWLETGVAPAAAADDDGAEEPAAETAEA